MMIISCDLEVIVTSRGLGNTCIIIGPLQDKFSRQNHRQEFKK